MQMVNRVWGSLLMAIASKSLEIVYAIS